MKSLRDLPNALEAATSVYNDNVLIPKQYLIGLQNTQVFEQMLHIILSGFVDNIKNSIKRDGLYYQPEYHHYWTYKDLVPRIKAFLPVTNNEQFYSTLKEADEARNKFVHECFKEENGLTSLDLNDFYKNSKALEILEIWNTTYLKASKEIGKIIKIHFKEKFLLLKEN